MRGRKRLPGTEVLLHLWRAIRPMQPGHPDRSFCKDLSRHLLLGVRPLRITGTEPGHGYKSSIQSAVSITPLAMCFSTALFEMPYFAASSW